MTGTTVTTAATPVEVTDELEAGLAAVAEIGSPENVEQVRRMVRGKDGVLLVRRPTARAGGKVTFHDAFDVLLGNRPPERVREALRGKRGQMFLVRGFTRELAAERAKYEARVRAEGDWDSGNLARWQVDVLRRLVAAGVLLRRPGRPDEMTVNGLPEVYEPAAGA
jgi:predicted pyridoxine 5'-phosphate oxidase superfamily flavin-nucleotide-binding protein